MHLPRFSTHHKFTEGELVVLREGIDYTFEDKGRPDVHLPQDLEGRIKGFHQDGHALVSFQFEDRGVEDHYVLTDDFDKLAPCYDTDQHPYADHGTRPQRAAEDQAPLGPVEPAPRLSNPPQFLPIIFVNFTIAFLYIVYVMFHCLPMMQVDEQPQMVDKDARKRGLTSLVAITIVTLLLIIAYLRAILTHPGGIPDDDPKWKYHADEQERQKHEPVLQEKKKNNERRHCKHCWKYKPDRAHHCKVCGMCILKMDHHCPWIYNCVGFHNYKFFFLLLMYSVICTHIIVWTMGESVMRSIEEEAPFMIIFFTLFGVTLAASLSLILTLFWMFHVWLLFKGLTTIEFCEKQAKDDSGGKEDATFCDMLCGDVYTSKFDFGACANMKAVLGDWIILWFLPCNTPSGEGFSFPDPREPFWLKAVETKRGLYSRSSHKRRVRNKLRESFV